MSKAVLVGLVAEKHGMTKAEATEIVNTVLSGIQSALVNQGGISFVGFGSFSVTDRAARDGRNPNTGESVKISARKVVKFTPGEPLKKAINGL
ncbi:HU family DNA-binding protein [Pseudomonas sp. WS 5532]|uniref:HU family DNA-binding protein n=1 Tax=Pseudomonas sp. WS 5532 TaxID=2717495 RepID=UPI001472FC65|nr:HU family DNA-binding protein [Pseudomonas sp. WS 5532]NMX77768.1 HU family DNA-binding protein [Pseudomonas sp. WS 5532]